MSKRRWLYLILLLLPVLLVAGVVWWLQESKKELMEVYNSLPAYPNSRLVQGVQVNNIFLGIQICYPESLEIEEYKAFATKDSKEQAVVYYNEWVIKQKHQLESKQVLEGQSNYCLHQGFSYEGADAVGFVYLNSSEPEAAKRIQKNFPGLDKETNLIIFLHGKLFGP